MLPPTRTHTHTHTHIYIYTQPYKCSDILVFPPTRLHKRMVGRVERLWGTGYCRYIVEDALLETKICMQSKCLCSGLLVVLTVARRLRVAGSFTVYLSVESPMLHEVTYYEFIP